jgi:hypothetical protein
VLFSFAVMCAQGYTTTVSIPASATHEQTIALIMLANNLDEGMVGPRRQPPQN